LLEYYGVKVIPKQSFDDPLVPVPVAEAFPVNVGARGGL
jgi:hypothetical protein